MAQAPETKSLSPNLRDTRLFITNQKWYIESVLTIGMVHKKLMYYIELYM
jgi:hypothetical protein